MGTTDNNTWTRVQQSVRETERLIGQKQYNLAMIKARQTLEFMVNCLGEKALIVDGDLADSIDQLFEGHWISQATKDHYHRIRVLGNKAVHDGNDSPYDANEAYQLLSQEATDFANIYSGGRRSTTPTKPQQRQTASRPAASGQRSGGTPPRSGSGQRSSSAQRSGSAQRSSSAQRSGQRSTQRPSSANRSRRRSKNRGFDPYDLLRPAVIFLIIFVFALIVFFVFKGFGKKGDGKESTAPSTSPEVTTEAIVTPEPATDPEPPTEAPKIYKTTASPRLNVRAEPSTTGALLGTLAVGTVVDYVQAYNDEWAVIMFEGQQAYVSSQYLAEEEATAPADAVTETSSAAQ